MADGHLTLTLRVGDEAVVNAPDGPVTVRAVRRDDNRVVVAVLPLDRVRREGPSKAVVETAGGPVTVRAIGEEPGRVRVVIVASREWRIDRRPRAAQPVSAAS